MTVCNRFPRLGHRYDQVSRWASRHVAPLVAVSVIGMAFAVALSVSANINTASESKQRSAVDRARTAQINWDRQNADHEACVRQSRGRAESRRTFYGIFDTLAMVVRDEDLAVVAELRVGVGQNLPDLDCKKLAPEPKGPRPVVMPD